MQRRHPARSLATLAPALILALALAVLFAAVPGAAAGAAQTSLALTPTPGAARPLPAIPDDITPEQVDALLATATDAQARALLGAELRRRAQRNDAAGRGAHGGFGVALVHFRKGLERLSMELRGQAGAVATGAALAPGVLAGALVKLGGERGLGRAAGEGLILLAAGLGALWAVRRQLAGIRGGLAQAPPAGPRLLDTATRTVVELLPVAAFAAVALGLAATLYGEGDATADTVIAYASGALLVLAVEAVARVMLSPGAAALRPLPVGDGLARFAYRWTVAFTAAGTFLWLSAGLLILTGVPIEVHFVVVLATGGLMLAMAVAALAACREPVADFLARDGEGIRPGTHSALRAQIARSWHWLGYAYLGIVYLLWSYNILARKPSSLWPAIGSVALVVALPLLDRALSRAAARLLGASAMQAAPLIASDDPSGRDDATITSDAHEAAARAERHRRYVEIARAAWRLALGVLGAVMLLELWDVGVLALFGAGTAVLFWSALAQLAVTLVGAWFAWRVVCALVDPHIRDRAPLMGDEEASAPQTRAETLLPLLRATALTVIALFATLMGLSAIGIDTGPLLAGAGVVGLAIGFGAQALVRDIVSGIFFLIDDAFRVGEYIEFGDLRGEVEAISLRSLRLRHHRGAIHTVPFGELRSITNYNRDWVILKMEFRLPADTDVERVRKLIKKIGQELMEDPEVGPNMLQPLKSQGIHRVEESALILRTKFMSKPREQFIIRRKALERIQRVFAENGIHFAPRAVRVHGGDGPADAAAAAAIDEPRPGAAALAGKLE